MMHNPADPPQHGDAQQEIRQRAKSPQQKALRRQQILDAAARRFSEAAFDKVNLVEIATDVGITKAALYRYFRSKETLFLALYVQQLAELVDSAEALDRSLDPADACVTVIEQHPLFLRLNAILHGVLEQNLTVDEARAFKTELLPLMARFAQQLSDWLGITPAAAIRWLMHCQASMIGCWHIAYPAANAREVMQQPPFDVLQVEFSEVFRQHIRWLVDGLLRQHGADLNSPDASDNSSADNSTADQSTPNISSNAAENTP